MNKQSILVVDDEKTELRMVGEIIKSSFPDSYDLLFASDGKEAIDIYNQYKPYLVIMDVQMPIMNGLDALKTLIETYDKVNCIVLSAHDEFDYAIQALRLGVNDYLLKPIRQKQLIKAIKQIKSQDKGSDSKQLEIFSPYIEESIISSIVMDNLSSARLKQTILGYFQTIKSLYLIQIETRNVSENREIFTAKIRKELESIGLQCLASFFGHHLIVLANGVCTEDAIRKILLSDHNISFKIAPVSEKDNIATVYKELNGLQKEKLSFSEVESVLFLNEKNIAIEIALQKSSKAKEMIEDYFLTNNKLDSIVTEGTIKDIYSRLTIIDHYLDLTVGNIQLTPFSRTISNASSREIKALIDSYVDKRVLDILEKQSLNTNSFSERVVNDIEKNYSNCLYSLNQAASNLNMSSAYLSKVFKDNFSKNFTKYLNEVRVREAKRMLIDGVSIGDVASRSGFSSFNYFCTVFKKYTGVSASEYQGKKL